MVYKGLCHGQVHRVFELAKFLCQPRLEPAGRKRKMKSPEAAAALAVKKTSGKRGCGKKLTLTKTRTSAQELTSAKPLGHVKKSSTKSSGLSVAEKASLVGIGAASRKPKCTVNLFGSNSSASYDESSPRGLENMPRSPVFRSKFQSLFRRKLCLINLFLFFVVYGP
jgi:hypothetical protein